MKRIEPQTVGEIISRIMAGEDRGQCYDRQKIAWLWGEILGPTVNRVTMRRYVEGKTLHVYISSAAIKNELMYMSEPLVKRLNEAVGREVIDKICLH